MPFFLACSKCLRDWNTFGGRASRSEYWYFHIGLLLVLGILGFMVVALWALPGADELPLAVVRTLAIVLIVIVAYLGVASISVTVRRLHDRNLSGWWYAGFALLSMVQSLHTEIAPSLGSDAAVLGLAAAVLVATLIGFVLMVLPGTTGPNRFGPDPVRQVDFAVFS